MARQRRGSAELQPCEGLKHLKGVVSEAPDQPLTLGRDQIAIGFKFVGTAAFKGGGGELRCVGGIVQGDVDSDKVADFEIKVNLATLLTSDFIL